MAALLSIRRRIRTAQNVSKTTRALQMISASKLKKAQDAALRSRPYVDKLTEMAKSLAPKNPKEETDIHPYMQLNSSEKTLYILISPDKGQVGSLLTNLIREYYKSHDTNSLFITVGKKIEGVVAASHGNLLASYVFGTILPSFDIVFPIVQIINEQYLSGNVGKVKIITTHFNSVFSTVTKVTDLLPIQLLEEYVSETTTRLYEPSSQELLAPLLSRYIESKIFQHLLESYASEQAARMIAMQNATNNAKDIVSALTLVYNKARQEKITNEILDITSAAIAMEQEE